MSKIQTQIDLEKDLYNLPSLQKKMSLSKNINVSETLKIAEKLYEKGLITYPRVDREELPYNINEISKDLFLSILLNSTKPRKESIRKFFDSEKNEYKKIKTSFIENIRLIDNEINIQHSAIIPTTKVSNTCNLSENELFVYESIIDSFISGFEKRI